MSARTPFRAALGLVLSAAAALLAVPASATAAPQQPPERPQDPPAGGGATPEVTAAEREWQEISDAIIPKLVQFRSLPEAEQRKETFRAELARIGEYVRKHQATDPFYAATARVFMATQILGQALHRDREAIEVLRDVAVKTENAVLAGIAALNAGNLLLRLGDEAGLKELRELYAGRAEHDAQFLGRLDELCRQVLLRPGRPFPELPLVDLAGKAIETAKLRGKLVVVLVFNLDHEGSKQEFEQLVGLMKASKDPALTAIGISVDRDVERVRKEVERLGARFPIDCSGKEWEGPAIKALGLTTLPATFLVDPKGAISFSRTAVVGPELEPIIQEQLASLRAEGSLPPLGGAR